MKVTAVLDGGLPLFAQFPRRSSLLKGIEPGARIAVDVTLARVYRTDRGWTRAPGSISSRV